MNLARCDRCNGLYIILGKDPGHLTCHYCDKRDPKEQKLLKESFTRDTTNPFAQ